MAPFYDRLMDGFDHDRYLQLAMKYVSGGNALDLGCGSGRFSVLLAEHGFRVTAVDNSREMLNIACGSARSSLGISFVQADMTELPFFKKYDLISVVCDGVNYIKGDKLAAFFADIYARGNPHSVFIFDISTEYKLKSILGDNFYFEDLSDLTYFWRNKAADDHVDMQLTFFSLQNGVYKRTDEEQRQYIHTLSFIAETLEKSWFSYRIFDGNSFLPEYNGQSQRLIFVCTHRED